VTFFKELGPATEWQARQVLLRTAVRSLSLAPEIDVLVNQELADTRP
jgi:hypothetical protein